MEPARMSSLRKGLSISEEWPVLLSGRAVLTRVYSFLFTIVDPLRCRHRNIPLPHELRHHLKQGANLNFMVIGAIGSEVLIAARPAFASKEGLELQGVYSFDGLSMKWGGSKYAYLPKGPLSYHHDSFVSAADIDRGCLYVAGGYEQDLSILGVKALDIKTRMWVSLPDPHVKRALAVGVMLQGRFHMIGGTYGHGMFGSFKVHHSGEVWDPTRREWTLVPELWPSEVFGENLMEKTRVTVVMDRLYALRRVGRTEELMYYESVSKSWMSLGKRACVATKPTFSQPISWRTLPRTFKRALPIRWSDRIAVLQV